MLNKSLDLSKVGSSLAIFFASISLVGALSSCGGNKVDIGPNPQNIQEGFTENAKRREMGCIF